MKRQDKFSDTPTFHYHNANPKKRYTSDCAFRTIAVALRQSWEDTVTEMAILSCKNGYSINSQQNIDKYLASKGWIKHKQPKKADNTKYKGREFCEQIQLFLNENNSSIIANVGSHHMVAIIDGKIYDTWNCSEKVIGNYWTKKK